MPTFEDPKRDADELAETARTLAYATRVIDAPADTYEVLGALHLSFTRLQQSLTQLAAWHQAHREDAAWLSAAAAAAGQAGETIAAAQGENGHIAWRPTHSVALFQALEQHAAALEPTIEPTSAQHRQGRDVTR